EACGGAQQAFQLLMLEHLDKMVESSARAISNIKFDKVVVWENGGQNGTGGNTASFLHSLARTMPPMMQVLKDVGGVELPETLARFTQEPHAVANGGGPAAPGGALGGAAPRPRRRPPAPAGPGEGEGAEPRLP